MNTWFKTSDISPPLGRVINWYLNSENITGVVSGYEWCDLLGNHQRCSFGDFTVPERIAPDFVKFDDYTHWALLPQPPKE